MFGRIFFHACYNRPHLGAACESWNAPQIFDKRTVCGHLRLSATYLLSKSPRLPRPSFTEPCTSPQFTAQLSDVVVAPSSTALLECGASGSPQPTITWYKDDLQVTLDMRIVQGASGDLQISNVQSSEPSDAGHYHCIASNTAGSVRSLTAELRIACELHNIIAV